MDTLKEIFRLVKLFFTIKRPLSPFDFIPDRKNQKATKKNKKNHYLV